MKNELLVAVAIEYDDDGGAVFWHILSISRRTGIVYLDLKYVDDRASTIETIHNDTFSLRSEVRLYTGLRRLAACIKPLPYKRLRPPTLEEISRLRSLYGAWVG